MVYGKCITCNGCGMQAGNAFLFGHLFPSPIYELAYALIVEGFFCPDLQQFYDIDTKLDLCRITSSFHGILACQQGALTLPDTWFYPFWDLLMLQLLRPVFPNLPCLFSTFYLEYTSIFSRFCSQHKVPLSPVYTMCFSTCSQHMCCEDGAFTRCVVHMCFCLICICFPAICHIYTCSDNGRIGDFSSDSVNYYGCRLSSISKKQTEKKGMLDKAMDSTTNKARGTSCTTARIKQWRSRKL